MRAHWPAWIAAVGLVVAFSPGIAIAATDTTGPIAAFSNGTDDAGLAGVTTAEATATLAALSSRIQAELLSSLPAAMPFVDDTTEQTATGYANEIQAYVNERASAWSDWLTQVKPDDINESQYNVVKLAFRDDGETAIRYAIVTVSDGNVTDVAINNNTDRSIDYTLAFSEYATHQLRDDLEWVYAHYAEPDKPIDGQLRGRLAATYGPALGGGGEISVYEGNESVTDNYD